MGAGQSTTSKVPQRALHVLRVSPSSPASETTIEPYFDFVVGFKDEHLTTSDGINALELERIVESHEGRPLDLLVWNSKSQTTRGKLISTSLLQLTDSPSSGANCSISRMVYGATPARCEGVGRRPQAVPFRLEHAYVRTRVCGGECLARSRRSRRKSRRERRACAIWRLDHRLVGRCA